MVEHGADQRNTSICSRLTEVVLFGVSVSIVFSSQQLHEEDIRTPDHYYNVNVVDQ